MPALVGTRQALLARPWTPARLAVFPTQWWDATDENTITLASGSFTAGGPVSAIANKGSAGGAATQGTSALRPTYSRTGFGGGRRALVGDGTQYLDISGMLTGSGPSAIFLAGYTTTVPFAYKSFITWGGAELNNMRGLGSTNTTLFFGGLYITDVVSAINSGTPSVVTHTASTGDGQRLFVNGVASGAASAALMNTTLATGKLFALVTGGDIVAARIGEIIVLNYVPTADERRHVEAYLKAKWGTP